MSLGSVQNSNGQGYFTSFDANFLTRMGYQPGPAILTGVARAAGATFMAIEGAVEDGVCEVGARLPLASKIHTPCKAQAERARARVTAAVHHFGRGLAEAIGAGPVLSRFDAKNRALEVLQAANEKLSTNLTNSRDAITKLTTKITALEADKSSMTTEIATQMSSLETTTKVIQEKEAIIQDLQTQLAKMTAEFDATKAQKEEFERKNAEYVKALATPGVAKYLKDKSLAGAG